jgi:hypothetical protein
MQSRWLTGGYRFDSLAPPPYFRGMPRRSTKATPAKLAPRMRSWRVSLLRAQYLGNVDAPDERAAAVAAHAPPPAR